MLVSSHVLAEVAQTVDYVVIIARGRLVRAAPLDEVTAAAATGVRVRTSEPSRLVDRLAPLGVTVTPDGADGLLVSGCDAQTVGRLAAEGGIPVLELTERAPDLEQVFLELTGAAADPDLDGAVEVTR